MLEISLVWKMVKCIHSHNKNSNDRTKYVNLMCNSCFSEMQLISLVWNMVKCIHSHNKKIKNDKTTKCHPDV